MFKKSLIGLIVVALAGGGYWYYDDYQKKEKVRLLKERNEYVAKRYKEIKQDAAKGRENAKKLYEERRKRIEAGTAKVELIEGIDKTGKKYQYTLIDGKKEGKSLWWYKSGRKSEEANYKDDRRNGEFLSYYDNESNQLKYKNFYLNGHPKGEQLSWYENGKLKSKAFISRENPKLGTGLEWYKSGIKKRESRFHEDKNKFVIQFWYENRNLQREYEKNEKEKFDGLMTKWYASGQIKSQQEYKNGTSNGLCQNWNEAGELISKNMIYDGLVIGNDGFGKCK